MSERSSVAYIAMAADILHHGHINIINEASRHGTVVVGLLTDDAIQSYKRQPLVSWEDRKRVLEQLKNVALVIPQTSLDYRPNLSVIRPKVVVHGDDWKTGPQAETRSQVLECIDKWGGVLVEPTYTCGISTSDIIDRCQSTQDSLKSIAKTR